MLAEAYRGGEETSVQVCNSIYPFLWANMWFRNKKSEVKQILSLYILFFVQSWALNGNEILSVDSYYDQNPG